MCKRRWSEDHRNRRSSVAVESNETNPLSVIPGFNPRRGKPRKAKPCPVCGVEKQFVANQLSKDGKRLTSAFLNVDGSRHHCDDFLPRLLLNVQTEDRERVKALGARWNARTCKWWVPFSEEAKATFAEWDPTYSGPENRPVVPEEV